MSKFNNPIFFNTILQGLQARALSWGFIAVLAGIALFSTRLVLETQPKDTTHHTRLNPQRHVIDYSATQPILWRTSLDGSTQHHLSANYLVHYRDDLSAQLDKPILKAETIQPNQTTPTTPVVLSTLHADHANLYNDGELIEMIGSVKVVRALPNQPATYLTSELIQVFPDDNRVKIPQAVLVTQGKDTVQAQGGVDYAHNDSVLHLTGRIHAIFNPPNFSANLLIKQ